MKNGRIWVVGVLSGMVVVCTGCGSGPELTPPRHLVAPYDTAKGEVLWAVVPLRNESGTTVVEPLLVTDKLIAAVEEAKGVRAVPLNRVLQAMAALEMPVLRSPGDARRLAQAMSVDAVLVGSITSYDPYTPTVGMALALYQRPGLEVSGSVLNPRALAARSTEPVEPQASHFADSPVALVSEHLDAKNNQVLMDVKSFAEGRMKNASALGWRRYTASMDLYTEFAVYHVLDRLLAQEWTRLPSKAGPAAPPRQAKGWE